MFYNFIFTKVHTLLFFRLCLFFILYLCHCNVYIDDNIIGYLKEDFLKKIYEKYEGDEKNNYYFIELENVQDTCEKYVRDDILGGKFTIEYIGSNKYEFNPPIDVLSRGIILYIMSEDFINEKTFFVLNYILKNI